MKMAKSSIRTLPDWCLLGHSPVMTIFLLMFMVLLSSARFIAKSAVSHSFLVPDFPHVVHLLSEFSFNVIEPSLVIFLLFHSLDDSSVKFLSNVAFVSEFSVTSGDM